MGGLLSWLLEPPNQREREILERNKLQRRYNVGGSPIYSASSILTSPCEPAPQQRVQGDVIASRRTQSPTLLRAVWNTEETSSWKRLNVNNTDCQIIELDSYGSEYMQIRNFFKSSTKRWFQVEKIESVQNPFLMAMYCLRKEEMRCLLGGPIQEDLLFHGTRLENVNKICNENFNWRLHGKSIGNRYGQGVSFSKVSFYASHYSSKNHVQKKMIVAKVIIGRSCIGNGNMVIPDAGCDTSIKPGGKDVIVKYQDYEYYPAYIITYTNSQARE